MESQFTEAGDSLDMDVDLQVTNENEDSIDLLTPSSSGVAKRKRKVSSVRSASASSVRSESSIAVEENKENKQKALHALNFALESLANDKKDEFDVFGSFVASELRTIPNVNDARRVKLKLQVSLANSLMELEESVAMQPVRLPQQQKIVLLDDHGIQITDTSVVNDTLSRIPQYELTEDDEFQPDFDFDDGRKNNESMPKA